MKDTRNKSAARTVQIYDMYTNLYYKHLWHYF